MKAPLRVVMIERHPAANRRSIERVFATVRRALPSTIAAERVEAPFPSRGVLRRVANLVAAACHRSAGVTHVTGDIHYVTLLLRKSTTVLTIHDLVSMERLGGWRRHVLIWLWYRLPIRRCGAVTVISSWVGDQVLALVPDIRSKLWVIPNPVGNEFVATPRAPEPRERSVVLQVGTGPNKNLERLAQAMVELPVHLRIVGPLDPARRRALAGLGIDFSEVSGLSDAEMVAEYQRCDVVAFVSTYEGFGLPIVEAQAVGRPVLTSTVASMPEVAGGAALLVDPFDVAAIRAGLAQLLAEPELVRDLVERGAHNAKRYAAPAVAARYAELYQSLAR